MGHELLFVRFGRPCEHAAGGHEFPRRRIVKRHRLVVPLRPVEVVVDVCAGVAETSLFGVGPVGLRHVHLAVVREAPTLDAVVDGEAVVPTVPLADIGVSVAGHREMMAVEQLPRVQVPLAVGPPVGVEGQTVVARIETGHHAGPGRCADWRHAVGPVEADAFFTEPFEVRRSVVEFARPVVPVKGLVVDQDEENVRLLGHVLRPLSKSAVRFGHRPAGSSSLSSTAKLNAHSRFS